MFYVHLIIILALFEFSYVPGACNDDLEEALEANLSGIDTTRILCPAESKDDIDMLNKFSTTYSYLFRYCLFHKEFSQEERKVCLSEMKPIFKVHIDKESETEKEIRCGFGPKQLLFFFGYYYCGTMKEGLKQLRNVKDLQQLVYYEKRNNKNISFYDICYDMDDNETLHTTHKIWHPSIYQTPGFQEQSYSPTEISTEPFFINRKHILEIKKFYDQEKKKNPNTMYRMLPHPMVPPQHFAWRTLKKLTNHYFNMAPLWENLIPLMNVIDEGIKKAALNVFKSPENEQDETEEFLIFTKVTTLPIRKYNEASKKWFQILMRSPRYRPNIWRKLVYNEKRKQAVIIYIHNTPEEHVEKKCTDDKIVECNFNKWSPALVNTSESPTKPIDFRYAYCCQTTEEEANDLFYSYFTIENILDIDSIIALEIEKSSS